MSKDKTELQGKLDQNIPASAVEKRSGGGGKELSYLTGAYVINRLNEVLGQGNWGYTLKSLTKTFEGKIIQGFKKEEVVTVSYIAQLVFEANIEGKRAFFEEIGYGDGTDKTNPGKAHELATKEAVTDALKRAAKNLGISFGLGLYFKSEEYVDETPLEVTSGTDAKTEPKTLPVATKAEAGIRVGSSAVAKNTASQPASETKPSESKTPLTDTKAAREKIKLAFKVLNAQKKITKDEFVTKYLAGGKADTISDEQVIKAVTELKQNFKELSV